MTAPRQLHIEDFTPGQRFPGATSTCTVEDFLAFARITGDAHPIHYDADYAAKTRFRKPLAHGLLVAGYSALGATPLSAMLEESMVAMLEVSFRFRKPVFADDVLTSHFEVAEVVRDPAKDTGRIRFTVTLANAAGETVVEGSHAYLLRARGKAA
ncbi:MAG TPA: MaoC/PaaZ C-terminal domain-containing protein [Acetobacteraceae bacterium]|nr:MaoC/PaaZ C-terminal domain-containing protein [Acetobacteraceae bacterium]